MASLSVRPKLRTATSVSPRLQWFALRVPAGQERAVAQTLDGRFLEPYVPVYGGRRPLFSGFVFCHLNEKRRHAILGIQEVLCIAGSHGSASPIPGGEIASIKKILASGLPVREQTFLRLGQRVRIADGALAGLDGVLLRKGDDFRVVVGMEALQRSVAIEIKQKMVRAVEGAPHAQMARLYMVA
jgi:hypothetical protein